MHRIFHPRAFHIFFSTVMANYGCAVCHAMNHARLCKHKNAIVTLKFADSKENYKSIKFFHKAYL
jgi:hypothetical protein